MSKTRKQSRHFRSKRRYNGLPDLPDQRDFTYLQLLTLGAPSAPKAVLPKKVDLREACPPVVNQGKVGSCTANELAGACLEKTWSYTLAHVFKKPVAKAYTEAKKHCISSYYSLRTLDEIRECLAQGYPVAFGFSVYESFESALVARTGVMPVPAPTERPLGGHAVLAVGYDDSKKQLIVRNSWGEEWGDAGYFYMPYAIIDELQLARDFWTIRK